MSDKLVTETFLREYIDEVIQGVHDRISALEKWIEEVDDKLRDLDDTVQMLESSLDSLL